MATCKTRLLQEDIETILKDKRRLVDALFDEFDRVSDVYKEKRADFIVRSINCEMENITDINCTFTGLIPYELYSYAVGELRNIEINFMLRFNAKMKENYFKDIDV